MVNLNKAVNLKKKVPSDVLPPHPAQCGSSHLQESYRKLLTLALSGMPGRGHSPPSPGLFLGRLQASCWNTPPAHPRLPSSTCSPCRPSPGLPSGGSRGKGSSEPLQPTLPRGSWEGSPRFPASSVGDAHRRTGLPCCAASSLRAGTPPASTG